VDRISDLQEVLANEAEAQVPEPRAVASSGAFVQAKRRGRRAG
jgi:hypothetical protein